MKKLIPLFFKILSLTNSYLAAKLATVLFTHPQRKTRDIEEMSFLKTGKIVNFKSKRKARTWGEGPTIWLIHGWESRGSTFYKLIPLLVESGYQAVAWDGPAHGDSPGFSTHIPGNARSLVEDINEGILRNPKAFIGHSFGGATLAVVDKLYELPTKVVIISAPTQIKNIFTNFAKLIKLSSKATAKFINLSEKNTGYTLNEVSLSQNDLSLTQDILIIHDEKDTVIPYSDFEKLQHNWSSGTFVSTQNLGHRLTIKNPEILKVIVDFLNS